MKNQNNLPLSNQSTPLKNFPAKWWMSLPDHAVQCHLCPRECRIKESGQGFCFARQNIEGKLVLATYGRVSSLCVDPIEKKPLYHFYPGSDILSLGSIGCNLGCRFCQNWNISSAKTLDGLMHARADEIADAALKKNCPCVAFTYNDPVVFAEYAMDIANACHGRGIKTVVVTAGYIQPQARKEFFSHIDAANVDLKSFSDDFYQRLCNARLGPVLDTLTYLVKETNVWTEITTLIIPGENDSDDELRTMTQWISKNLRPDIPLHFSAFYPNFKMTQVPQTAKATLSRAREIALGQGLKHVYTGNVIDDEGSSTFCLKCGKMLIKRLGYEIRDYHLNGNQCEFCKNEISGCFKN